ncbi:MAG: hypothetical protein JWP38_3414 [Herbaspirillum sp.]|jgi:hypothetical protein|nr:hypothetical protein [Herbaspirillum sp.]
MGLAGSRAGNALLDDLLRFPCRYLRPARKLAPAAVFRQRRIADGSARGLLTGADDRFDMTGDGM